MTEQNNESMVEPRPPPPEPVSPRTYMLFGLAVVLMCVGASVWMVVRRHNRGPVTVVISSPPPPAIPAGPCPESVEGVWRQLGAAWGIPKDGLDEVADIANDALSVVQKQPDEAFVQEYQKSLHLFMTYHGHGLKDPSKRAAAGRWLGYCTAEALRRERVSDAGCKRLAAEYRAFYQDIADEMRTQAWQDLVTLGLVSAPGGPTGTKGKPLTKEELRDLKQTVTRSLDNWVDWAASRTAMLQEDLIFPSLSRSLSADLQAKLKKLILEEKMPPFFWRSSGWTDSSHGEPKTTHWFAAEHDLNSQIRQSITGMLFHLVLEEEKPKVRLNPYWGHMLCRAMGGSEEGWPIYMELRIGEARNRERGWTRKGAAHRAKPEAVESGTPDAVESGALNAE